MKELIEKAKEHLRKKGYSWLADNSNLPEIIAKFAEQQTKLFAKDKKETVFFLSSFLRFVQACFITVRYMNSVPSNLHRLNNEINRFRNRAEA